MRPSPLLHPLIAVCALLGSVASGAWQDKTAGRPWLEFQPSHRLNSEHPYLWFVERDSLGRLLVGSSGLSVFDGQEWTTHRAGTAPTVRQVVRAPDGRLWAAALNELGYFTELSLGRFDYHSVLDQLPESERQVGHVWGCALVGRSVFFVGEKKLYRWDGSTFKIWPFPGDSRLFPSSLDGETWLHHRETGLHRLTEQGPKLEVPAGQLPPDIGIQSLTRDARGVLALSSSGFFRLEAPLQPEFSSELNALIATSVPSAMARGADGTLFVGTIRQGLLILSPEGVLLRQINERDHPAAKVVINVQVLADGTVWFCTTDGLFRLEPRGVVTLHSPRSGLEGGVQDLDGNEAGLYAVNRTGAFRLQPGAEHGAHFERDPRLMDAYFTVRLHPRGLLLGRHGGVDFYDGTKVTPAYAVLSKSASKIRPSRHSPGSFLVSEGDALVRLEPASPPAGFAAHHFGRIPDYGTSLAQETHGPIWVGTTSQGAFLVNPATDETVPFLDPATGQPFKGPAVVTRHDDSVFVFVTGQAFQGGQNGSAARALATLSGIVPVTADTPADRPDAVLAFKRSGHASASPDSQGLGRLRLEADGRATWQELDVPALASIGLVQIVRFLEEAGRPVLWIGGTEGLLRLDYDAVRGVVPPPAPLIRLDTTESQAIRAGSGTDFSFDDHRVALRVFTGDPTRAGEWQVQTRLGQGGADWSPGANRRGYVFTNLSEGTYRFEARTVNPAGQASEPAVFTFRVRPPWFRSPTAYAGYAVALGLGVWLTIRLRERRSRERTAHSSASCRSAPPSS